MEDVTGKVYELIEKAQEKSKGTNIIVESLNYAINTFVNYKLIAEDGMLKLNYPDINKFVNVVKVEVIPSKLSGMNKLRFSTQAESEWKGYAYNVIIGYIKTDEKRSPDRLHKAVVYGDDNKQPQFKSILKSRFNVEEKHLVQIKLDEYVDDFVYINSLNGVLYEVMLFKYFEDNIANNTIFNTCYINLKGDTNRVIFGEESDIDKQRKWYTGRISKAFKSEEGDFYLYLNMDLIDSEDDETEKVVYKVKPFI